MQPGFQAQVGSQLITTSQSTLNQAVDLSSYDSQDLVVTFTALNSDGETTTVTEHVYVDLSQRLAVLATVPGKILDFDPTRILFRASDDSLVVRDRSSQRDTMIWKVAGSYPSSGWLTSAGAVWFSADPPNAICLDGSTSSYFWNGATPIRFFPSVGADCGGLDSVVAGDWALTPAGTTVNLKTGATASVPSPTEGLQSRTIAANGDVFEIGGGSPSNVYRERSGGLTLLGAAGGTGNGVVLTDSVNLVFDIIEPGNGCWLDLFSLATAMQQPLSQQMVPPSETCSGFTAYSQYQASNGWTAFVKPASGVNQVWSASPSGQQTQLSVFNTDSSIDAVGPTGEVMFLNQGDRDAGVESGRYLRLPPALPERINSTLGVAVSGCDGWYVRMGGTLFQVTDTEDAGTGCTLLDGGTSVEGGSDDAGGDAAAVDASENDGPSIGDSGLGGPDATVSMDGGAMDATESERGEGAGSPPAPGGGGGCAVSLDNSGGITCWMAGIAAISATVAARRIRRKPLAERSMR